MRIKFLAVNLIISVLFIPVSQTAASDEDPHKPIKAIYLPMTEYYSALDNSATNTDIVVDKVDSWQRAQKLIADDKVDVVFITCPLAFEMLSEKPVIKTASGENTNSSNKPIKKETKAEAAVLDNKEQINPVLMKIIESRLKILEKYAAEPIIINEVKKQNSELQSQEEITDIDNKWIAGSNEDFINTILNNNISKYLRKKVKSNKLLYTEAFLCDNQGAIVGTYPVTSDYWQGDEAKFTDCFKNGTIAIGPLEFDESTNSNSVQISIPVKDAESTIGVLIVGLRNIKY